MSTTEKKTWYILYTKPKAEKKVAEALAKRNIEHYHPLIVSRQQNEKRKMIVENLFASYVFVNLSANSLHMFRNISGVVNFVYWQGSPAVVKNEEITAIKQFLTEYPQVQLEKTAVRVGDMVRISQGAAMHKQGKIVQIAGNSIKLELPSLGYTLVARSNNFKIEEKPIYSFGEVLGK